MKKRILYLIGSLLVIALVLIVMRWNDYREKDLIDVLDSEEIKAVHYRNNKIPIEDIGYGFNGTVTDPGSIQELVGFFSQYKVKKTGLRNFSSKYSTEQFVFLLEYTDDRITIPSLIEHDVVLFQEYQYRVTNGPVDYNWIEDFIERHE